VSLVALFPSPIMTFFFSNNEIAIMYSKTLVCPVTLISVLIPLLSLTINQIYNSCNDLSAPHYLALKEIYLFPLFSICYATFFYLVHVFFNNNFKYYKTKIPIESSSFPLPTEKSFLSRYFFNFLNNHLQH